MIVNDYRHHEPHEIHVVGLRNPCADERQNITLPVPSSVYKLENDVGTQQRLPPRRIPLPWSTAMQFKLTTALGAVAGTHPTILSQFHRVSS